jgi:hypothetical protein
MAKEHLKYESTEIDHRLDLAGTALQEHQDISHLATKDEVDTKVDKVDGKGLSTEDFTTDEKNKLASLENYDDTQVKEDIATIKTGKQDVIKDLNTIREGASKGATALQSVPSEYVTKTQLDQKVDKVSGKQLSTEDYTTAEKTKLRGLYNYDDATLKESIKTVEDKVKTKQDIISDLATIRERANKGATAIQEVKTINGEPVVGSGNIEIKGTKPYDDSEIKEQINSIQNTIPTNVSQLVNDKGYLTKHQDISHLATKAEVSEADANITAEMKSNERVTAAAINNLYETKADKAYVDDAIISAITNTINASY